MKNRFHAMLFLWVAAFLLQACAHGPYKGRVVE